MTHLLTHLSTPRGAAAADRAVHRAADRAVHRAVHLAVHLAADHHHSILFSESREKLESLPPRAVFCEGPRTVLFVVRPRPFFVPRRQRRFHGPHWMP